MSDPVKKTFSFRTEVAVDLNKFIVEADKADIGLFLVRAHTEDRTGESYVEFATYQPVTIEQMRDIARAVPDGHVMVQTLREQTLKENSLERDYDLE